MPADPTGYDLITYPGYTHPQTHPDRLAVVARLFGLQAPGVTSASVLELGCGNGSNLIPLAASLPGSKFTGIDLAARPVEFGNRMVSDLGLTNVRLIRENVTALDRSWGEYDYIVAHGLYSWVPAEVRRHVLRVCQELLSPQGVAFISYNTLPGGHLRNMLREMMRFHVRGFTAPEERVAQAKALVRFLADGQDTQDDYRRWLKAEAERILDYDDGHLYHDDLAEVNEPMYFVQFMDQASRCGLQYLGEADFFEMSDHIFKEPVREALCRFGPNRIPREQYLDFLKCRRFRQTLLCRTEVPLATEPLRGSIADFQISSAATCRNESLDVNAGITCLFETPGGARVETDFALGKAALAELSSRWPMPMSFDELLRRSGERLAGTLSVDEAELREALSGFLLNIYGAGAVEFRTHFPPMTTEPGDRPMASAVARWQIQHSDFVTTALHQAVRVEDQVARHLLSCLDGTRDRNALADEVRRVLKPREAHEPSATSDADKGDRIHRDLNENLRKLARLGLLIQ